MTTKQKATDPFEFLYTEKKPVLSLGEAYQPQGDFRTREDILVAKLSASTDGYNVRVYECRMPARFFRVEASPSELRQGPEETFVITTGSGSQAGELAGQIAKALASGMLGLDLLKGGR